MAALRCEELPKSLVSKTRMICPLRRVERQDSERLEKSTGRFDLDLSRDFGEQLSGSDAGKGALVRTFQCTLIGIPEKWRVDQVADQK